MPGEDRILEAVAEEVNRPSRPYQGHAWLRVPRFRDDESKTWEERYRALWEHHVAEMSFLVEKVRQLGLCEAVLQRIVALANEGDDVRLTHDLGGNSLTIHVGLLHTHVGYRDATFEILVNNLYNGLHGGPALSWHAPGTPYFFCGFRVVRRESDGPGKTKEVTYHEFYFVPKEFWEERHHIPDWGEGGAVRNALWDILPKEFVEVASGRYDYDGELSLEAITGVLTRGGFTWNDEVYELCRRATNARPNCRVAERRGDTE